MELKDFVSQSIISIVRGVVEAQSLALVHNAHVNPGGLLRNVSKVNNNSIWDNSTNNYAQSVAFDLAVTVEDSQNSSAKIGVLAGFVGAGVAGSTHDKNTVVSRLSFTVPVLFPVSPVGTEARTSAIVA